MPSKFRRIYSRFRPKRYALPFARARAVPVPPVIVREPEDGVLVVGHFSYTSGLKQAAVGTVDALRSVGISVDTFDIPVSDKSGYAPSAKKNIIFHVQPSSFGTCLDVAAAGFSPASKKIAVWFWETESVPTSWGQLALANGINEIWAPTSFIANAFTGFPVPVVRMLPALELGTVVPVPRNIFGIPDAPFVFLFIFDVASTLPRKNPYAVIDAFKQAFPDGNAVLVIKAIRGSASLFGDLPSNIVLIQKDMPREELLGLVDACDCFVSLHRSEGFGLLLAEAMLLGKPVIATGYSGNMDFMDATNSFLVEYSRIVSPVVVSPYDKPTWAEPSIPHAAHLMRFVVGNPEISKATGERARQHVRTLLSFGEASRNMSSRLI